MSDVDVSRIHRHHEWLAPSLHLANACYPHSGHHGVSAAREHQHQQIPLHAAQGRSLQCQKKPSFLLLAFTEYVSTYFLSSWLGHHGTRNGQARRWIERQRLQSHTLPGIWPDFISSHYCHHRGMHPSDCNSNRRPQDSKLTKLLKHSLGGNSVTLMLACIAPVRAQHTDSHTGANVPISD